MSQSLPVIKPSIWSPTLTDSRDTALGTSPNHSVAAVEGPSSSEGSAPYIRWVESLTKRDQRTVGLEFAEKVRNLYSCGFDRNEFEKLADLFTKDTVCAFGETFSGDWGGRDEIREKYIAIHDGGPV